MLNPANVRPHGWVEVEANYLRSIQEKAVRYDHMRDMLTEEMCFRIDLERMAKQAVQVLGRVGNVI
jgi:hypothetical protein